MTEFPDTVTLPEALRMMIRVHDPKLAERVTSLEAVHAMQSRRVPVYRRGRVPKGKPRKPSPDAAREVKIVAAAHRDLYAAVREKRVRLRGKLNGELFVDIDPDEQRVGELSIWGETLACGAHTYKDVCCLRADVESAAGASFAAPASTIAISESPAPEAALVPEKKRPGPAPGAIDRFGKDDRALYPEIGRLMREQNITEGEAARRLAPRIKGRGNEDSRIRRLAGRYRKEGKN
jgi:hypothetical protein